jgi:glyoxylase-like metal-dependent hydrolase (beta-lactamase superfamily II)
MSTPTNTTEGLYEITNAERLYEIKTPGRLYEIRGAVNVFLIDDAESGVTVIDAGMSRTAEDILAAIQAIGRTPQDVRHILITHADMDHIGGLATLVQATGAAVVAGAETKGHLEARTTPPHLPLPMRFLAGIMSRLMLRPVSVGQVVADGETLPIAGGIRAIAAPGHTPDNFCFYWERGKALFAPDLLRTQEGSLGLTQARITWDMAAARRSAAAVLALEPAYICVGHGPFVDVAKRAAEVAALREALAG